MENNITAIRNIAILDFLNCMSYYYKQKCPITLPMEQSVPIEEQAAFLERLIRKRITHTIVFW
jgi:hypothetical protein